jgi:hypothetical protein
MELEHRQRLQELTRVPYRGDRWLAQSERWFDAVLKIFPMREHIVAEVLPRDFVLSIVV